MCLLGQFSHADTNIFCLCFYSRMSSYLLMFTLSWNSENRVLIIHELMLSGLLEHTCHEIRKDYMYKAE